MWSRVGFAILSLVLFNAVLVGGLAIGAGWYHWRHAMLERLRVRRALERLIAASTSEYHFEQQTIRRTKTDAATMRNAPEVRYKDAS